MLRRLGRRRRALHLEQRVAIGGAEGELARDHLEEQHAERVEVRVGASLLAARLLGRHVLGRSEHGALRREARVARERGQAEVQNLHEVFAATARGEQDVVALQIAVHHAEVVRARKRCAHLLDDVDAARERHRARRELGRERRADEVLHHQIELAVVGLADVVDVDDVRVVDAIGGARLAQHPRAEVRLSAEVGPNQLDRDHAVDEDVSRAIDDAHAAFADARFEAIAAGDDFAERWVIAPFGCRAGLLGGWLCH